MKRLAALFCRVSACAPDQWERIAGDQEQRHLSALRALGFQAIGATVDKRHLSMRVTLERLWFGHADDPGIAAVLGTHKQKRWFYFWAAFEDGSVVCVSSDENQLDLAGEFGPDREYVWYPATDEVASSYEFFRRIVEHRRQTGRRTLRFAGAEDGVALVRYYNRQLMTWGQIAASVAPPILVVGNVLFLAIVIWL